MLTWALTAKAAGTSSMGPVAHRKACLGPLCCAGLFLCGGGGGIRRRNRFPTPKGRRFEVKRRADVRAQRAAAIQTQGKRGIHPSPRRGGSGSSPRGPPWPRLPPRRRRPPRSLGLRPRTRKTSGVSNRDAPSSLAVLAYR